MDEVESPFNELLASVVAKCPKFMPAIFSQKFNPKKIEDLLNSDVQAMDSTKEWLSQLPYTFSQVSFSTTVSYAQRTIEIVEIKFVNDLDFLLNSPEQVLMMLLSGTEAEINIAVARFLELNEYDIDFYEGKSIFNEIYNHIYALRVLICNIPGFRVVVNGGAVTLPLTAENKIPLKTIFNGLFFDESAADIDQQQEEGEANGKSKNGKNKKRRRAK